MKKTIIRIDLVCDACYKQVEVTRHPEDWLTIKLTMPNHVPTMVRQCGYNTRQSFTFAKRALSLKTGYSISCIELHVRHLGMTHSMVRSGDWNERTST